MSYKNFEMTDYVDQQIAHNDRSGIVSTLISICYRDKSFSTSEFDDGVEYVTNKFTAQKLFVPFSATPPLYEKRVQEKDSTLAPNDFADSICELGENFCPERIEDTKRLGKFLYPKAPARTASKGTHKSRPPMNPNSLKSTVLTLLGVIAAVIAVVLIVKKLLS